MLLVYTSVNSNALSIIVTNGPYANIAYGYRIQHWLLIQSNCHVCMCARLDAAGTFVWQTVCTDLCLGVKFSADLVLLSADVLQVCKSGVPSSRRGKCPLPLFLLSPLTPVLLSPPSKPQQSCFRFPHPSASPATFGSSSCPPPPFPPSSFRCSPLPSNCAGPMLLQVWQHRGAQTLRRHRHVLASS